MSRLSKLQATLDPIKAAESSHERLAVTLRLSPLAQFILEGGIQHRLRLSRTRAVSEVVEAGVLDWLEGQDIDPEGAEFKAKYLQWLTRIPVKAKDLYPNAVWAGELDPEEELLDVVVL